MPGLQAIRAGLTCWWPTRRARLSRVDRITGFLRSPAPPDRRRAPATRTARGGAASAPPWKVLHQLDACVVKPCPGSPSHGSFNAVVGRQLSRRTRRMGGRIVRQGGEHGAGLPADVSTTWHDGRVRSASCRARSCACSPSPRMSSAGRCCRWPGPHRHGQQKIASMQRGGSSADVWVLRAGEVDAPPCCSASHATRPGHAQAGHEPRGRNLFWLGHTPAQQHHPPRAPGARLPARRRSIVTPLLSGSPNWPAATWCCRRCRAPRMRGARVRTLADRGPGRHRACHQRRKPARIAVSRLGGARAPLMHEHWKVISGRPSMNSSRCAAQTDEGDCSPRSAAARACSRSRQWPPGGDDRRADQ